MELSESFPRSDGGDGGAGCEDLVGFEGLVALVVGFCDLLVAGGVDGEELVRGFLGNDSTVYVLALERGRGRARELPLDYLVPHFLESVLNLCDIDILAPGLLALAGGLSVLRGGFLRGRHVDCLGRGSGSRKRTNSGLGEVRE